VSKERLTRSEPAKHRARNNCRWVLRCRCYQQPIMEGAARNYDPLNHRTMLRWMVACGEADRSPQVDGNRTVSPHSILAAKPPISSGVNSSVSNDQPGVCRTFAINVNLYRSLFVCRYRLNSRGNSDGDPDRCYRAVPRGDGKEENIEGNSNCR